MKRILLRNTLINSLILKNQMNNNLYPYIWTHPFDLLFLLCTSDQQQKHKLCRDHPINIHTKFNLVPIVHVVSGKKINM